MTTSPASGAAAAPVTKAPELPHADLDALEQSVQGILDRKRIGRPVFVRYSLLAPSTGRTCSLCWRGCWTRPGGAGQPIATLYALGTPDAGQVSLAVQTPEGATALVSAGQAHALGDGIDLMVVGDHGAIYHDAGQGLLGCSAARYRQAAARRNCCA